MNVIHTQNAMEAIQILKKAGEEQWEVRVSKGGNVRIASWIDQFKSEFTALINPSRIRTNWTDKAKSAIYAKLRNEISSFQKDLISDTNLQSLISNIKDPQHANLKDNLKELWKIHDKKIYNLALELLKLTNGNDSNQTDEASESDNHSTRGKKSECILSAKSATEICSLINYKLAKNYNEARYLIKAYHHLTTNMKENSNDALLCLMAANAIRKEKKITLSEAIESAFNGLDKIKGAMEIAPFGCQLKLDGSTTLVNHIFTAEAKTKIINYLNNPNSLTINAKGISNEFAVDTNRQEYTFTSKNGKSKTYRYHPENSTTHDDEDDDEESKVTHQLTVTDSLIRFAENDTDLAYALSLVCNQSVGNAFMFGIVSDTNSEKNGYLMFLPDKHEINNPTKNDSTTLRYNKNGNIEVHYKMQWKLDFIKSDNDKKIFIKNQKKEFNLECEYVVEYIPATLRQFGSEIQNLLNTQNKQTGAPEITNKPNPKILSYNLSLRLLPDWNRIIIGEL